jgi:hypothetical protein
VKIRVSKHGGIEFEDVFNGIGIVTDQGYFGIAQRDSGIEVLLNGEPVFQSITDVPPEKHAATCGCGCQEKADETRVCSQVGCTAAIIKRDNGETFCAAGHESRWVDRGELQPHVDELRGWLATDEAGLGPYLDDLHRLLDAIDGGTDVVDDDEDPPALDTRWRLRDGDTVIRVDRVAEGRVHYTGADGGSGNTAVAHWCERFEPFVPEACQRFVAGIGNRCSRCERAYIEHFQPAVG